MVSPSDAARIAAQVLVGPCGDCGRPTIPLRLSRKPGADCLPVRWRGGLCLECHMAADLKEACRCIHHTVEYVEHMLYCISTDMELIALDLGIKPLSLDRVLLRAGRSDLLRRMTNRHIAARRRRKVAA